MSRKLYGFHPVREALRSRPGEIAEVLVGEGRGGGRRREIEELCRRQGVAFRQLPEGELHRLSLGVDNGFLALVAGGSKEPEAGGDSDLRLLVEDVQDPRNLGALLRVCEAAGVGRVLVRDRGSAPLSAVAAKASAGASEWLACERTGSSARTIAELKEEGFWVYGLAVGGLAPWEVDLTGKVLLCVGGEEAGLRELTRRSCDRLVGLPMRGRVGSLNLATAAAATLFEAVRQRLGGVRSPEGGGPPRPCASS